MNLSDYIVTEDKTVLDVMNVINNNGRGVAFICKNDKLLGIITDGDIRRYILGKGNLNAYINEIANYNPIYVTNDKKIDYFDYMKKNSITVLPILNNKGKVLSIHFLYDNKPIRNSNLNIPVVIMAGGKGTRLYPYTQILPKPLIPIGEKTITEIIMDQFETFGCNHFDMIVNYKKNLIKSFFLDSDIKHEVEFIDEDEYMGTGGGLKLLTGKYTSTFFMTNCDVLIEEDYSEILNFHKSEKNLLTMVCAMKNVTLPYGTVDVSTEGKVLQLTEKPNFSFMTNTGVYVIEPEFLEYIPHDKFVHITDVIQRCIDEERNIGVYPISETAWMDMGQLEELENMKKRLNIQ